MALPLGDLSDLMGGILGAGTRGSRASVVASSLDDAFVTRTPAPPPPPQRWRRAALLLLLVSLWSEVDRREGLPPTPAPAPIATGQHLITDPSKAMTQNAADRGTEITRVEPRIAAPQRPGSPPRATPLAPRPKHEPRQVARTEETSTETELGSLDGEIIRRYVERSYPSIMHCYQVQLRMKQTLAGTLQTHFFVLPSGAVESPTARGVDAAVAECVTQVLSTIQFPVSGGKTDVKYKFDFTALPDRSGPAIPVEIH
ncbi:MAG TPA: AgmX/PglI C-terminal domain-containing protein [Kofleriaceae bacterium]|jgi:hypothetical protein|nr:AgmX/PglI C-terminal domain-containing protein [Kofleriaceae bacterium]